MKIGRQHEVGANPEATAVLTDVRADYRCDGAVHRAIATADVRLRSGAA